MSTLLLFPSQLYGAGGGNPLLQFLPGGSVRKWGSHGHCLPLPHGSPGLLLPFSMFSGCSQLSSLALLALFLGLNTGQPSPGTLAACQSSGHPLYLREEYNSAWQQTDGPSLP